MGKIVGNKTSEVNVSVLDFFTLGHIVMGYITWIISWILVMLIIALTFPITVVSLLDQTPYTRCLAIAITCLVGIIWEYLENFLFTKYKTNVKFEGRKDSLQNSLTDIVAVIGGGIFGWIFSYLPLIVFTLISIDLILALLVLMKKLEKMTKRK